MVENKKDVHNFHFPILDAQIELSHMKYQRKTICPSIS